MLALLHDGPLRWDYCASPQCARRFRAHRAPAADCFFLPVICMCVSEV